MDNSTVTYLPPISELATQSVKFYAVIIAAACTILAVGMSTWQMIQHLRNFNKPTLQRCIVRIILMIPIYSGCSLASLIISEYTNEELIRKGLELARDCYESYLLYQFFSLMVGYLNEPLEGDEERFSQEELEKSPSYDSWNNDETRSLTDTTEERVVLILLTKPTLTWGDGFYPIPVPCLPCEFMMGRSILNWMKRGIMQFMILSPLSTVLAIILTYYGLYSEGSLSPEGGYLYIAALLNISVTICLYFLFLFYHAVRHDLAMYNPIPKFICLKAIIAISIWQQLAISVLVAYGYITDDTFGDISARLGDFLICVEMLFIAIGHFFTYGHEDFVDQAQSGIKKDAREEFVGIMKNFAKTVDQRDVLKDMDAVLKIPTPLPEMLGGKKSNDEEEMSMRGSGKRRSDGNM